MPNVKSILNDIEKLPLHQKEQILSTLEEILVLGSQTSQVEQEVNHSLCCIFQKPFLFLSKIFGLTLLNSRIFLH